MPLLRLVVVASALHVASGCEGYCYGDSSFCDDLEKDDRGSQACLSFSGQIDSRRCRWWCRDLKNIDPDSAIGSILYARDLWSGNHCYKIQVGKRIDNRLVEGFDERGHSWQSGNLVSCQDFNYTSCPDTNPCYHLGDYESTDDKWQSYVGGTSYRGGPGLRASTLQMWVDNDAEEVTVEVFYNNVIMLYGPDVLLRPNLEPVDVGAIVGSIVGALVFLVLCWYTWQKRESLCAALRDICEALKGLCGNMKGLCGSTCQVVKGLCGSISEAVRGLCGNISEAVRGLCGNIYQTIADLLKSNDPPPQPTPQPAPVVVEQPEPAPVVVEQGPIVIDGEAIAPTFIELDTDGDGVKDTAAIDHDGDGEIDQYVAMGTVEGGGPVVVESEDAAMGATIVGIDQDGDGEVDAVGIDNDGDGRIDEVRSVVDAEAPLDVSVP